MVNFISSSPTINFELEDVIVTGGILTNFSSSSAFDYSAIFTPSIDGMITIDVASNSFTDDKGRNNIEANQSVSYTHLTLPTNREV